MPTRLPTRGSGVGRCTRHRGSVTRACGMVGHATGNDDCDHQWKNTEIQKYSTGPTSIVLQVANNFEGGRGTNVGDIRALENKGRGRLTLRIWEGAGHEGDCAKDHLWCRCRCRCRCRGRCRCRCRCRNIPSELVYKRGPKLWISILLLYLKSLYLYHTLLACKST